MAACYSRLGARAPGEYARHPRRIGARLHPVRSPEPDRLPNEPTSIDIRRTARLRRYLRGELPSRPKTFFRATSSSLPTRRSTLQIVDCGSEYLGHAEVCLPLAIADSIRDLIGADARIDRWLRSTVRSAAGRGCGLGAGYDITDDVTRLLNKLDLSLRVYLTPRPPDPFCPDSLA